MPTPSAKAIDSVTRRFLWEPLATVIKGGKSPTTGIWEVRSGRIQNTYPKSCVGLPLIAFSKLLSKEMASSVRRSDRRPVNALLKRFTNTVTIAKQKCIYRGFGEPSLDAAMLAMRSSSSFGRRSSHAGHDHGHLQKIGLWTTSDEISRFRRRPPGSQL